MSSFFFLFFFSLCFSLSHEDKMRITHLFAKVEVNAIFKKKVEVNAISKKKILKFKLESVICI